jgi:hypothetical protein
MKSNKWLFFYFFLEFILVGCITETSTPTIQPTQATVVEATAIPSPANTSSLPAWCMDLKQENGLPASDEVRNSSIVYEAYAFDNEKHVINPVWEVSLNDGSEKLLAGNFPTQKVNNDKYNIMRGGFSLSSTDQKHVATWGESSNPDGSVSLTIRDQDTGQNTDIFHTNTNEYIDGNWSPDGKHFIFTSYKNTRPDYSLVYAVNADGTGLRVLTELNQEYLERPHWSPDGKKIAIPVWSNSGGIDIMVINFQTGVIKRFKVSPIIRFYPSSTLDEKPENAMLWSSDSQWFAYISQYEHNGIEILNTENGKIYCGENEKVFGVEKIVWRYDRP